MSGRSFAAIVVAGDAAIHVVVPHGRDGRAATSRAEDGMTVDVGSGRLLAGTAVRRAGG